MQDAVTVADSSSTTSSSTVVISQASRTDHLIALVRAALEAQRPALDAWRRPRVVHIKIRFGERPGLPMSARVDVEGHD